MLKLNSALFVFAIIGVITTVIGFLRPIQTIGGVDVWERGLRAIITLGIGMAFYLTIIYMIRHFEDFTLAIRWVYYGFIVALSWGTIQAVNVLFYSDSVFRILNRIQKTFSIRKLFPTRISGLTLEPNWFADQIAIILLPWLISSIITGFSVFNWRWKRITIEHFLLIWAASLLVMTYSRAGLALLILYISLVTVFLVLKPDEKLNGVNQKRRISRTLMRIGISLVAFVILILVVFYFGRNNIFISRIWEYWGQENYFFYLGMDARFIYWKTSFNIFKAYPLTGVGLGNYAFYFPDFMTEDFNIGVMPEILRLFIPGESNSGLITPKILYGRIAAEMGVIGLSVYIGFLASIAGLIYSLKLRTTKFARFCFIAGVIGFIGLVLDGFSYDSFALPNMWILLGLIVASATNQEGSHEGISE